MMFSASCSPRYYYLSVYDVTQKQIGKSIVEGEFILRDIREENNEVILEFENVYDELYYKVIEPKSTFKNKDFPEKDKIYQLKLESWFVRSIRGLTLPTPQSSSYNRITSINGSRYKVEENYEKYEMDLYKILSIKKV